VSDQPVVPDILRLTPVADRAYQAPFEPVSDGVRDVVFGGQILAQMIVASGMAHDFAKEVKSIHTVFARAGSLSQPLVYEVETMHDGRTFGSDTVTCRQNGKVIARALILLSVDEPDVIRHSTAVMPDLPVPAEGLSGDGRVFPGAEVVAVEPAGGAPLQAVWTRYRSEPAGDHQAAHQAVLQAVHQAVLAWATDGYLIGAALLPHADFSEDMAHRTLSTGVVSHTVNFHERFDARDWLLLVNESEWAGRGRTYGRADVFDARGRLVATFTQDSMIRSFAEVRDVRRAL
jgi:acyl-CoA thioesterase II